ncbi:MAG: hypothetical protein ABIJ41_01185 [Candidatus Omnitrophota bacterium]
MRRILLIFLCLQLVGCASFPGGKKISDLESSVAEKDQTIKTLQESLQKKEEQLAQKDSEITKLRKQLETFGVFNK